MMLGKINAFVRNNAIAVLLAFIAPMVLWYYVEREHRSVTITLDKSIPIVPVQKGFAKDIKDIQIMYQGKPIPSLTIVQISVRNSGNTSIASSDFETPIALSLDGQVSIPEIVSVSPSSLAPHLATKGDTKLVLEPLLLNSGDSFKFRVLVIDQRHRLSKANLTTRIKGVKDIRFVDRTADEKSPASPLAQLFGILLGALTAATSIFVAVRFLRDVPFGFKPSSATALSQELESTPKIKTHTGEIAERLHIANYDYKSNLLLLRVKLEGLLQEIARTNDIPVNKNISLSALSRALQNKCIISQGIATGLSNILPIMNKELHTAASYLSDNEFAAMQRLALNIIAVLESKLFQPGSPCQMSGQPCPACGKGVMDVSGGEDGVRCNKCGVFIPAVMPDVGRKQTKQANER